MLYPEVATDTRVLAIGLAFAVGGPVGLGCYALLRPLRRRGRTGRFVAQLCAWWLAVAAGLTTAAAIGGPYVIGSRRPVGGGDAGAVPLTRSVVLWTSTALAVGYAVFGLAARYEVFRSDPDAPPNRPRAAV